MKIKIGDIIRVNHGFSKNLEANKICIYIVNSVGPEGRFGDTYELTVVKHCSYKRGYRSVWTISRKNIIKINAKMDKILYGD